MPNIILDKTKLNKTVRTELRLIKDLKKLQTMETVISKNHQTGEYLVGKETDTHEILILNKPLFEIFINFDLPAFSNRDLKKQEIRNIMKFVEDYSRPLNSTMFNGKTPTFIPYESNVNDRSRVDFFRVFWLQHSEFKKLARKVTNNEKINKYKNVFNAYLMGNTPIMLSDGSFDWNHESSLGLCYLQLYDVLSSNLKLKKSCSYCKGIFICRKSNIIMCDNCRMEKANIKKYYQDHKKEFRIKHKEYMRKMRSEIPGYGRKKAKKI